MNKETSKIVTIVEFKENESIRQYLKLLKTVNRLRASQTSLTLLLNLLESEYHNPNIRDTMELLESSMEETITSQRYCMDAIRIIGLPDLRGQLINTLTNSDHIIDLALNQNEEPEHE